MLSYFNTVLVLEIHEEGEGFCFVIIYVDTDLETVVENSLSNVSLLKDWSSEDLEKLATSFSNRSECFSL